MPSIGRQRISMAKAVSHKSTHFNECYQPRWPPITHRTPSYVIGSGALSNLVTILVGLVGLVALLFVIAHREAFTCTTAPLSTRPIVSSCTQLHVLFFPADLCRFVRPCSLVLLRDRLALLLVAKPRFPSLATCAFILQFFGMGNLSGLDRFATSSILLWRGRGVLWEATIVM